MAKKTKRSGQEGINAGLALTMKSGKVNLGYKTTMSALRNGNAKLVIIADNLSPLRRSQINYMAHLAKVGVYSYTGDNNELGLTCGKLFRVATLAVLDAGDSDIVTLSRQNK